MALHCNGEGLLLVGLILPWALWAFTIIEGCHPVARCGKGHVVALHGVCSPNAAYCCLAWHTRSLALVTRGLLSSCMMYAANCPCGKGLIVAPSPVAILGKGFVVPFLARGSLWPSLTDVSSLAYSPYSPSAMYGTTLAYSMYLPLATYMPLVMYTPSPAYLPSAYLRRWSLCGAMWSSLHSANDYMKVWLLHGSCTCPSLAFVVFIIVAIAIRHRNDCCVINFVIMSSWSTLPLALCTFVIVNVVDPNQGIGLVVTGAIPRACCDQPLLPAL